MGLKDEIEKIIRAEQEKLEAQDQADRDYDERQRDRFKPLRALLDELATSIDPAHLKASVGEASATIEVGKKKGDSAYFESDARWEIEPNNSLFEELPGFKVEETVYHYFPEFDTFEKTLNFDTEEQVMDYLVSKIAEKVAFYRYLLSQ